MSSSIFSDASTTIANGTSLSPALWMGDRLPVQIVMPAAWTAAVLTFQTSQADGAAFNDLYDDGGNEVTVTAVPAHAVAIDPAMFQGAPVIKIRSGTGGAAVNQGADRVLKVIKRRALTS